MSLDDHLEAVLGSTAFDADAKKIGAVKQIYLDNTSGFATYVAMSTGLLSSDAICPLAGAELVGKRLILPFTKKLISEAPQFQGAETALSSRQEKELKQHYEPAEDQAESV